jgi:hypothetical protein
METKETNGKELVDTLKHINDTLIVILHELYIHNRFEMSDEKRESLKQEAIETCGDTEEIVGF